MTVYRDLGLTPIINASGAVTRLGGAPMAAEVVDAFVAAAGETVPLEQLQAAASKRIAEITGAEAGLITAGAAAALTLGTAAILARNDVGRMERLPCCDGFPNEFVVAREQRSGYDHAVRAAGARLVEVGFNEIVANAGVRCTEAWEYAAAFNAETVGVLYVHSASAQPRLEEVVETCRPHGIPLLVDAAGELPPRANLSRLIAAGADLVAFSGGKAIGGPQATGILCGRRELIASAALQMLDMDDHPQLWNPPESLIDRKQLTPSALPSISLPPMPRHGIGRGFKVSKEEIVALLKALEIFASADLAAEVAKSRERLAIIRAAVTSTGTESRLLDSTDGESPGTLEITVNPQRHGQTAFEVCRRLREGSPPVYIGHGKLSEGILVIRPNCLRDDQIDPLCKRLLEALNS